MKRSTANSLKKGKKRIDKTLVIIITVCVLIVVGVLLATLLPGRVAASKNRKEAIKFTDSGEVDTVVIYDPSNDSGEFFGTPRAELKGVDAKVFTQTLSSVLKNAKYNSESVIEFGVWKTSITLYSATDEYKLYIDESGLYIEDEGLLIGYKVKSAAEADFNALLESIQKAIG